MNDKDKYYHRTGQIRVNFPIVKVFPLLCPKREEEWIPEWECEVIFSKCGYNEEGAIFKTTKAYGTELYWYTISYDMAAGKVDFLITANGLFLFRFSIGVIKNGKEGCVLTFDQTFTPLTKEGESLIQQYKNENFNERLSRLERFMTEYLSR